MISTPLISVVMPVYNEDIDHIRIAIESVLHQSFQKFEFIIILDKPDNHGAEKMILDFQKNDNRILFLKNKKNIGMAGSINRGHDIAKGKYIARMDADDVCHIDRLEQQYSYMQKYRNIDLLFSRVNKIDNNGIFIEKFHPKRKYIQHIKKYLFRSYYLVHPSLFCKSKVLKENNYDEHFLRTQDFELWMRLVGKYRFDVLEKDLLDYRIPNQVNIQGRIEKIKKSTHRALKALNKNIGKYIFNWHFWMFYIKTLAMGCVVRMPKKIINFLAYIKDK